MVISYSSVVNLNLCFTGHSRSIKSEHFNAEVILSIIKSTPDCLGIDEQSLHFHAQFGQAMVLAPLDQLIGLLL